MKKAFTLMEILAVLAIVAIVVAIACPRIAGIAPRARIAAAESDMKAIRDAFMDEESGYIADMRGIPGFSPGYLRIANLLVSTNLYGAVEIASGRTEGRRVDDVRLPGCAAPSVFTTWDEKRSRGWRGPYFKSSMGEFPAEPDAAPGFYPDLSGLRLPADFTSGLDGCSIYGFPGEPAALDPWGNPYVLQIPPAQAFRSGGDVADVTDEERFAYARIVSAGPDGILSAPCFGANATNEISASVWNLRTRRLSRQAGLSTGEDGKADFSERGDDIVLFLTRNDVDEGEEE